MTEALGKRIHKIEFQLHEILKQKTSMAGTKLEQ